MNETKATDARRLVRLRELREDGARAALEQTRRRLEQAQDAFDRREQHIAGVRRDRSALLGWLCGAGATELPRLAPAAGARLAALDESIERAALALADERAALADAARARAIAQAEWLRARGRHQAVVELADAVSRRHRREHEQRAEREVDAVRPREH